MPGFTGTPGHGAFPGLIMYGLGGGGGDIVRTVPLSAAISATRIRAVPLVAAIGGIGLRAVPLVAAISKAVPLAARAPHRTTQMPDILAAFPPSLYSHDPQAVAVLTVTVGTSWRVDGDLLEISGGAIPFVCDLREFTLGALATALTTAGYTTTVRSGWAGFAATTLIDGAGRFADSPNLLGFTTVLFRLLRSLVLVWDLLADDLDTGIAQMDLRQAAGQWLDWWGALYGVPRPSLEADARYRTRIQYYTLKPRSNNVAIADAIGAVLGVVATVEDGEPIGCLRCVYPADDPDPLLDHLWDGEVVEQPLLWEGYPPNFVVNLPTGTDTVTVGLVRALVDAFRAAGTTYAVAFV